MKSQMTMDSLSEMFWNFPQLDSKYLLHQHLQHHRYSTFAEAFNSIPQLQHL